MNKPKLIPRLIGGLGNQLFIYSAARRLALVNNADLAIDTVTGFTYDTLYRRKYQLEHFNIPCRTATADERLQPFTQLRRAFKAKWNQNLSFAQRRYIVQEGIDYDPRLLDYKPQGTVYLEGYWQSEKYFKDVELIIRQDLQIRPPKDDKNLDMAKSILYGPSVAIHVRFFDELYSTSINNVPIDYYANAVKKMEQLAPYSHYFIFSDQPEVAKTRISLPEERVTLVTHNKGDENAFADLWLMSQCQHFIIANSTFSWWAAWLKVNPDKIVIAPGFEKRVGNAWWGFDGLLPEKWVKL